MLKARRSYEVASREPPTSEERLRPALVPCPQTEHVLQNSCKSRPLPTRRRPAKLHLPTSATQLCEWRERLSTLVHQAARAAALPPLHRRVFARAAQSTSRPLLLFSRHKPYQSPAPRLPT